jgi:hypothetical protein
MTLNAQRLWGLGALALVLILAAWTGPQALTFARGVKAYLYGYPLITADMTRRVMTAPGVHRMGAGPVNQFSHAAQFPDHHFRDVVAPNADTLYSIAWLDLSAEPMILHTPDMQRRWLLMEVLDGWSNAFASLGTRVYGYGARDYAIVGPRWQGTLPSGVTRVDCPTDLAWIIGRTYTAGTADYEAVHAVQRQYTLVPLSHFGTTYTPPPPDATPDPAVDVHTPVVTQVAQLDAARYFDRLAQLMADNPPAPADAPMVRTLARLGIVPGHPFDFAALNASDRRALDGAVWFVKGLFDARARGTQGDLGLTPFQESLFRGLTALGNKILMNVKNGWQIALNIGQYGTRYPLRAIVTLVGFGANVPADAVYPMTTVDSDGNRLNGASAYLLHFGRDALPPADVFWSLTMYDEQSFLVDNPIGRYTLGDRDRLQFNPDGTLDIRVQADSPGKELEANWLPAPRGNFKLVMRLYGPRPEVLEGRWAPPAVKRVTGA